MMSVPSARSGIAERSLSTRREVAIARVRPPHRLQDPRRAGLERQVDVLADRRALRDRRDHRLAEVLRMRAREADALDPLDRVAGAEELAELGREVRPEVAAPRVHVLAEQRDLADALLREPRHLGDDLARAPARPRGRAPRGRCSTRTSSCSPSRPAPTPGTGARGASAASRRTALLGDAEARPRRRRRLRRRATRRGAGSMPGPNATSTNG